MSSKLILEKKSITSDSSKYLEKNKGNSLKRENVDSISTETDQTYKVKQMGLIAPSQPKSTKLDIKTNNLPKTGITIKLNTGKSKSETMTKISVANAFNEDSDDEVEEMPAECKMRMRNIGRDTPTSSGPNSFGKTKHGFMDSKKMFEKSLKEASVD